MKQLQPQAAAQGEGRRRSAMATTREEITGLMEKVRGLSKQFRQGMKGDDGHEMRKQGEGGARP